MKKIILASCLVVLMSGCLGKNESASVAPSTSPATAGAILARLDGNPITDEEVRKIAGAKLAQAELEIYDARKEAIDQIVDQKLLETESAKQKTTKDDLLKKSVYDKIKVEDKDVEKFYNEKKDQMQGKKLEEVKSSIKSYLFREKYQKFYGDLMESLRKKANLEILIKAPKMEVAEGDNNPAIGPKGAPVTIIEFTDYQCPFCGRARPTVNQIIDTYKGKVRYVLRDFPLSFHKDSMKAHEAAHCAGDQDKYWDMNKKLFANQQALSGEDLKKYAAEIKLKMDKFNQCLDSGKYTQKVQQNQQYGETVGVSGTPAFFVNGRMLSGARPFENFKSIIDDELKNAK